MIKDLSEFNKVFTQSQKLIKESTEIRFLFKNILDEILHDSDDTFTDKITIRFSAKNNNKKVGTLKYLNAHRDTWGSNLFEQINWWFPVYDIDSENTIYMLPDYFNQSVENNSKSWLFKDYLNDINNYPSSPISSSQYNEEEKIIIKIKAGDFICFSGHHIHGSNIGNKNRVSIETRTVSLYDKQKYSIPKNLDSESKKIMTEWFENIIGTKKLKDYY